MIRRGTYRPVRTYREHVAAALGAVCGMLVVAIAGVILGLVLR